MVEADTVPVFDVLRQDFRLAARALRRTPAFTIAATLTLVIGIGAAATAFAIVREVLIAPLPYRDPSRLVAIWQDVRFPRARRMAETPAMYFTFRRLAHTIEDAGAYRVGSGNMDIPGSGVDPERVRTSWMTAETFSTLGVTPVLGRGFTDDEDRPDGPGVVVISDAIWRSRFGRAKDVLGKILVVNDVPRRVIGVMADDFHFPNADVQLWLPNRLDPTSRYSGDFSFGIVAHLRPGVSLDDARRELASLQPRVAELFPELEAGLTTEAWIAQSAPTPAVIPLRDDLTDGVARALWMLAGAGAIVLLVAFANVANLLLIRADARQLQVAVRQALGAGRLRVLTHCFAESAILAGFASVLALIVAWMVVRGVASSGSLHLPRADELRIDGMTVAFAALIAMVGAVFGGLFSSMNSRGENAFNVLRDNSAATTGSKSHHRLRRTISAAQIALALVALNGSALLLRTFHNLRSQQPGFDARNVTTFRMLLAYARYHDSQAAAFYDNLTRRVASVPGVEAAGITSRLPLSADGVEMPFYADPSLTGVTARRSIQTAFADSGYFVAMKIPLLAGRLLARTAPHETDVLVSRAAAKEIWHDASGRAAIGKRFRVVANGPLYTVVGVVGDVRDRALGQPPMPTAYFPEVATLDPAAGRRPSRSMTLVVKSDSRAAVVAAVRQIVREANPTLPLFDIESMDDVVLESTARLSAALALVGAAGLVTLVLGAVGLYGVMAYAIALRSRELSLRIALGAEPSRLVRMLSVQGLSVAAIGLSIGVSLFAAVNRFLRSFLYAVGPGDPIALASSVGVLLLIALIASWVPARRVMHIDANSILRA